MAYLEQEPISETIVAYLKEGVNLEGANDSPAGKAFVELSKTLKTQEGFKAQYWGHQVEHPEIFVWIIQWESPTHQNTLASSASYASLSRFDQFFDLDKAPPLHVFTRWYSSFTAALKEPVTEYSLYTLPAGSTEETKAVVLERLGAIHYDPSITNITADATGWVFKTTPANHLSTPWLHGIFGYKSIENHYLWRQTPEHETIMEIFRDLDRRGLGLKPLSVVPGIDLKTGFFHVVFFAG